MDTHTAAPPAAAQHSSIESWLDDYTPDSSVFASSAYSLMAHGTSAHCRPDRQSLRADAGELFAQARQQRLERPIIVGAIPFNAARPGFFRVPQRYRLSRPLQHPAQASVQRSGNTVVHHRQDPSGSDYETMVQRALGILAQGGIQKLVLSRRLLIELQQPLDRRTVLRNLLHSTVAGYTYALPLNARPEADPETFLGSSPELLIRRQGNQVVVNPLAGTRARAANPDRDQAQARSLLDSEKDRLEHSLVVQDVLPVLRHYCTELSVPEAPSLAATSKLWHLSTRITGRLRDPAVSSLDLAMAMHPTPAVCGTPTAAAMQAIETLEPFERGLFAGAIGWADALGNGEWAVAIRCAHYRHGALTLSAGAGIVPGSEPALERQETANKFMAMLSALGLDQTIDTL